MTAVTEKVSVRYDPPADMTPALMRCIAIGGYDTRAFAVAILSLVQDGFLDMTTKADGTIGLRRRNHGQKPKAAAARWLLKALTGRDEFIVGRQNYVRLLALRRGHAARLANDARGQAGADGVFFVAGLGLVVCLGILAVGIVSRAPVGVAPMDALLPYWPIPVAAFTGLWLWRRRVNASARTCPSRAEVDRFRRYIEVAMADRLNPRFSADGTYKTHDRDTIYAAAFGLENAWADPLVHLLEGLLPGAVHGTDLDGAVDAGKLTNKRGFAPRKQPGMWGPSDSFWRSLGEEPDD